MKAAELVGVGHRSSTIRSIYSLRDVERRPVRFALSIVPKAAWLRYALSKKSVKEVRLYTLVILHSSSRPLPEGGEP